ncbi:LicD family protein [Reichenbachiella carrageenanivorans]|uniref:LicD family protein n=1 Tax=Reichenbachiella carrageenanivorans TaxID=2979869 RepID=A0ABY6CXS2_9BACT|nr:LicD family protein [Reichenbachiella carrageenanivorans]UXX78707.1 LicD family protein [Reichenbachiella carrageenanivorans]
MNLSSIIQKLQRFIHVFFTTLPGNYTNKKLEILEELFRVTNNYMKSTGAMYWIDFGTLLGYHRENTILPHDIDVDFGCHEEEYEKVWSKRKELPNGFKLYDTSFRHRGPKLYFNYKGFDADVYFYEDKGNTLTSYENSHYPSERTPFAKTLALPVKATKFLEQDTFIPAQPKAYLEHIYNYLGSNGRRDNTTGYWYEKED